MLRHQLLVVGLSLAPFALSVGQTDQSADQASDRNDASFNSREFRAPLGFGGYNWKTPLGKIDRLAPEPVYVRVAHSIGKVTYFDISCYKNLSENGHVLAMKACRETDGDGFHALAEYYVDSQGFRISDSGGKVVLFPVTYQFCAHWKGFSNSFKGDPLEQMQLCGGRWHFRSETAAQEQAISDNDYRTAYARILSWLIKEHGEPEDFERDSLVFIPKWDLEPKREIKAKDRHRNWYWCQPRRAALVPTCAASIVMAFDAETGRGQILFVTAPVWAYAHARQFGGAEGDPLYRVLHGGMGQPKVEHQCMDSFVCRPPPPGAMPEELLARFRLANKAGDVKN